MEASRSCMRSLSRHFTRMGPQVWGGKTSDAFVAAEGQLGLDHLDPRLVVSGLRKASTAIAQASAPESTQQVTQPSAVEASGPPPAVTPGVNPNVFRGPRPNVFQRPGQAQSGMQRRVSQQVMALQQNMHVLMFESKFKEAVKVFEDFINEGFKEAQSNKLERGQLPLHRRPAEFQWLQYLQALNRSQKQATATITEALKLMKQVGIPPRATHYQLLLFNLMKSAQSHRALATIDEMIKSGVRPTLTCYENAIFACLHNKDLDATAMLLDSHFRSPSWRLQDLKRGQILYTRVVAFCAQLKKIDNAMVFMKQMQDLQMRVPVHLFLDIISNAAEVDECVAAFSLLSDLEMKQSIVSVDGQSVFLPIKLDEGLLQLVLNSAARYGETVLADKAWEMLKLSLRLPFFHELDAKVEFHAEAADDEQDAVEDTDMTMNPKPETDMTMNPKPETDTDENSGSTADPPKPTEPPPETKVNNKDVSGDWEAVLQDRLHKDRLPSVSCYHAYIEAQARGGQIETAFEAVKELEELYPNDDKSLSASQGLSMLADELAKDSNTVDQAFYLLDQWHEQGKNVTTPLLDVVVAACSRMGDANRAFETFEAYERLGVKQRSDSYNALMEVCAQNRQVEVIMKLVQEMAKAGVKPNVDTYMQIIEGYINNQDTSGITHALTITRREGFMPTLKVLERAHNCADRHNDLQAKNLIKREMVQAGYRFTLQVRGRGPGRGRGRGGRFGGRGGSGVTYLGAQQAVGVEGSQESAEGTSQGESGYLSGSQGYGQGGYQGRGRGRGRGRGGYMGGGNQGDYQGGYQGGVQGSYQGGYQGGNQGGYQGGSQGGYQGGYQGGNQGGNQGGYQGSYQGGYQGGSPEGNQGGYQGGYQGGNQGGYQGGYQGGNQGGYQGGYQGGNQGGYQGGYQGGNQGEYQGGYQGGYQGDVAGGTSAPGVTGSEPGQNEASTSVEPSVASQQPAAPLNQIPQTETTEQIQPPSADDGGVSAGMEIPANSTESPSTNS